MRRRAIIVSRLLWVVPLAAAAAEPANPVVGRWDVTIGPPPGVPSWFMVVPEGDQYVVHYVGQFAGVHDAQDPKVDGSKLTFKVDNMSWEGEVKGDHMTGTALQDNKTLRWTARRFVPTYDVSGSWTLSVDGQARALTLMHAGKQIGGRFGGAGGAVVREGSLTGDTLKFTARPASGQAETYEAKVKGDKLEGQVTIGGEKKSFTAERRRDWEEPIELFNGADLTGWKPLGEPKDYHWKVLGDILTNPERGANIVSDRKFKDFKIHVEFRVPKDGNSGVYLRGRYEIQVEDSFGKPASGSICGAIYTRLVPKVNASKPAGEWQTFDATLIGNNVTVVHNGELIIDHQEIEGITGGAIESEEAAPGPIYLQGDHSPIEYRKVTVTPAKPTVWQVGHLRGTPKTQPAK